MHIGVSPFAATRDGVIEVARAAVEGGLDTLWLGDGYLTNPDFGGWAGGMETMTELAWLAGRYPSARIGIAAAVLPLRDPVWLAKEAMTLDRLAGGGFVTVVTPGFWPDDLADAGIDFAERGAVFERNLDRLIEAIDERYSPGPLADGRPEVWLAGASATMKRAIDRKLPYQSSRSTPDELAPVATSFFDRGGTILAHRVRVEVGTHEVEGAAVEWHAVTGSPSQLVDALGRYRELGVTDLSIVPGQDDITSLRTVEVLVADVVPQL